MSHRLTSAFSGPFLCLVAVWLLSGAAAAADDSGTEAFTEPPKDDPNYSLQGEFVGPISVGENEFRALGLQVRSLGGDRFEARQFAGGLPGQEKHQGDAVPLLGRRSGEFLVLSGGPWAVFVEQDHCLVVDRRGEPVGRLERVERRSPTLGAQPPGEAIVLFSGQDTEQFTRAEMTDGGLLKQGADFKPMVQDFDLHVEFRLPYMPAADGQARGNSGVYLQSRYECQVLDSFAQALQINGCGSIYRFKKPDVNMCLPPLVWQTYDIRFTAPRWAADGSKLRDAHVTAWLNGVKIHDNVAVADKTGAGQSEAPTLLPTKLQDHNDPVRFRNVWMVDRGLNSSIEFPVTSDDSDAADGQDEERAQPEEELDQKSGVGEADDESSAKDQPKSSGEQDSDEQDSAQEQRPQEEADAEPKQEPSAGDTSSAGNQDEQTQAGSEAGSGEESSGEQE